MGTRYHELVKRVEMENSGVCARMQDRQEKPLRAQLLRQDAHIVRPGKRRQEVA